MKLFLYFFSTIIFSDCCNGVSTTLLRHRKLYTTVFLAVCLGGIREQRLQICLAVARNPAAVHATFYEFRLESLGASLTKFHILLQRANVTRMTRNVEFCVRITVHHFGNLVEHPRKVGTRLDR